MLRYSMLLLAIAGSVFATRSFADDAKVRAAIGKLAPGAKIDSLADAAIPGLTEVLIGAQVVYVSDDGRYLLQGSLHDLSSNTDLTEARKAKARQAVLNRIGDERRIRFPAQDEKHRVTVYTDIDCGYCRKLHQEMAEYNALGISVDYLFHPRAGIGSESYKKAVSVWCADDRQAAMTLAQSGQTVPSKMCANPLAEDFQTGLSIGVGSTPAVFTDSGELLGGYMPPAVLLERVQKAAGKR